MVVVVRLMLRRSRGVTDINRAGGVVIIERRESPKCARNMQPVEQPVKATTEEIESRQCQQAETAKCRHAHEVLDHDRIFRDTHARTDPYPYPHT